MGRRNIVCRQQAANVDSGSFAHGFVTLSDTAEFLYKTTNYYAPEYERSIAWNDAAVKVNWPYSGVPVLSGKDQAAVPLAEAELFA